MGELEADDRLAAFRPLAMGEITEVQGAACGDAVAGRRKEAQGGGEMKTTRYKDSELGPVPEDWEVRRFDQVFDHLPSKRYQVPSEQYLEGGRFPIVDQGQETVVGYTDDDTHLLKVPEDGVIVFGDHTRIVKYMSSDFVVGADGTQLLLGKNSCTRFLSYLLQGLDIPNLGYSRHFKYVKDALYLMPPLPEQRAIAAALSDVDGLLAAMAALIGKKRAIRQGAMQDLLEAGTPPDRGTTVGAHLRRARRGLCNCREREFAPRRRLAGFTGAWVEKRLGDCGVAIRGVGFKPEQASSQESAGKTMLLRSNNVQNDAINFDDVLFVDDTCIGEDQYMRLGDILICAANGSRNLVGKSASLGERKRVAFGAFMAVFRPNGSVDPGLIGYLLQSASYRRQLDDILTGSAINNLNARDIESLIFTIPPTLAEQKAIASVLSDMDAEIAALEAKRAKYEKVKQGMMQDLLTGKTRLGV